MSQFIETIQLLHGKLRNLEYHQERFERTRREVLGIRNHPRLAEVIQIPKGLDQGMLKCRLTYAHVVELIEFEAHMIKKAESLKLVYSDDIDYAYKYADRSKLEGLYQQRGNCDDILVIKNGDMLRAPDLSSFRVAPSIPLTPPPPLLNTTPTRRAFSGVTLKSASSSA